MPKSLIGDDVLTEMTEGHEVETVFNGDVTVKVSEGLPDGLENLRNAYQEFWAETHHSTEATTPHGPELENLTVKVEPDSEQKPEPSKVHRRRARQSKTAALKRRRVTKARVRPVRQRFGLPEGFVPRMQRFGRAVLLELNVYRLPDGQEFLPCVPTGTLGSRHLYALLTSEQYLAGRPGSVYVRGDGRIFDYSVVSANPLGDMFDTGYTIYDLERTGRYAPSQEPRSQLAGPPSRKRKRKTPAKNLSPRR